MEIYIKSISSLLSGKIETSDRSPVFTWLHWKRRKKVPV